MSGSDPTPGSQKARRSGFVTFWTTLPGILTGSAAVITAIVGLITLLNGLGGGQHNGGQHNGTANQVPVEIASSSGPATASSHLSNGIYVQRNRFAMKSPDDADLETAVVGSGLSRGDLYLYCSGTQCLLNAMSSLMTATEDRGTKSSCIAALSSRHDQALDLGNLRTGETLCVQTQEGHVGALRILGLPGVGTIEFTFSYILWN
jgi:hypothetical protein